MTRGANAAAFMLLNQWCRVTPQRHVTLFPNRDSRHGITLMVRSLLLGFGFRIVFRYNWLIGVRCALRRIPFGAPLRLNRGLDL